MTSERLHRVVRVVVARIIDDSIPEVETCWTVRKGRRKTVYYYYYYYYADKGF